MSDQIDTMVQAEINRRRAGAEAAEREAIRAELERQVELAALDRKNREQLARVTADGEQAMRLRSASRAPSGTPMAANGSAAPGEPQDTTEAASEADLARLEKRRAAAREYAASQAGRAAGGEEQAPLRRMLFRPAGHGREGHPVLLQDLQEHLEPEGDAGAAGGPAAGRRELARADRRADRSSASARGRAPVRRPDRRQELAASIRRVTAEIEQAKASVMQGEELAA